MIESRTAKLKMLKIYTGGRIGTLITVRILKLSLKVNYCCHKNMHDFLLFSIFSLFTKKV